jgi:hypothetical protein
MAGSALVLNPLHDCRVSKSANGTPTVMEGIAHEVFPHPGQVGAGAGMGSPKLTHGAEPHRGRTRRSWNICTGFFQIAGVCYATAAITIGLSTDAARYAAAKWPCILEHAGSV